MNIIYIVDFNEDEYYKILEGKGTYKTRVDKATDFVQRHVHVMCNGKECSWNFDGSRHDNHKFTLIPTKKAKDAARNALDLDPKTILEQLIYDIHRVEGDQRNVLLAETFNEREILEIHQISRDEYEHLNNAEIDEMINDILKLAKIGKETN